ncbi:unnamed protein product [Brassica rapa subsp. trilocularis]|uniref:(rape) hypothetical protein n=1 Tax=Brassica napus TaxID=3708 RepID=A0A817B1N3_BRANA|nr:unnamed protein product [Brassica napus]CAF2285345.1 unnamed protein product [Brassica napus]
MWRGPSLVSWISEFGLGKWRLFPDFVLMSGVLRGHKFHRDEASSSLSKSVGVVNSSFSPLPNKSSSLAGELGVI